MCCWDLEIRVGGAQDGAEGEGKISAVAKRAPSVGMDDASEAAGSAAQQVLNDEDLLFLIASFAGGGEGGGSERQRLIARAAAARSLLTCSTGFRLAVLRADHPVWQHLSQLTFGLIDDSSRAPPSPRCARDVPFGRCVASFLFLFIPRSPHVHVSSIACAGRWAD